MNGSTARRIAKSLNVIAARDLAGNGDQADRDFIASFWYDATPADRKLISGYLTTFPG